MTDPRYNKKLLLQMIKEGKAPIESLNPPTFKINLIKNGQFIHTIDGKQVSKEHYFSEMDRLFINPYRQKFDIAFRSETNSGK